MYAGTKCDRSSIFPSTPLLPEKGNRPMTQGHFEAVMEVLMARIPFEVFTIEQVGGGRMEIDHAGALYFFETLAVFRAPGGVRVLFDHESVKRIVDAPAAEVPE